MQDWDFLHHALMPGLKRKYGDAGEPGKPVAAAVQPPQSPLSLPRLPECAPADIITGQFPHDHHHEQQTEMPSWGAEVMGLWSHALPPSPETTGYQTAERVWQYLHDAPPALGPLPVATKQLVPQPPSNPPAFHRPTATSSGLPAISLLDDEALPLSLPPPSGGFPRASGEAAAPTPFARTPFAGHSQPRLQETHHDPDDVGPPSLGDVQLVRPVVPTDDADYAAARQAVVHQHLQLHQHLHHLSCRST